MTKAAKPPAATQARRPVTVPFPPRCLATDMIDMDHLWLVDPELGTQITAVRLETDSAVHKTMADASDKAAKILKAHKPKA
jgi:hypothetical protein